MVPPDKVWVATTVSFRDSLAQRDISSRSLAGRYNLSLHHNAGSGPERSLLVAHHSRTAADLQGLILRL
jgi:hypothetical protein